MYQRNIKMFPWFYGLWGFCPYSIIAILYFQQLTGSYAVAMSVFAASSLFSSLFEIPMGVVSDLIGRRRTMIGGGIAYMLSNLLYVCAGIYEPQALFLLFAGALMNGLGFAFYSGTDEAILFESLKAERKQKQFDMYYGKARSWNQAAMAMTALLGSLVAYYYSYQATFVVSLLFTLALLIFNWWWIEPPVDVNDNYTNLSVWRHFNEAVQAFRTKPRLRWLALANIIDHSSGLVSHRFETAYYELLIPTWLLGIPRVLKQVWGTMSFWFAGYFIHKFKSIHVLIYAEYLRVGIRLSGLAMNNFLSPFIMTLENFPYGASVTSLKSLLQRQYRNQQRATMSSMISMGSSLLFSILSVLVGWLADLISVQIALLLFTGLRLLILAIYYHLAHHKS